MTNSTAPVTAPGVDRLLAAARAVPDPEIPVITLGDLGVVRDLRIGDDGSVDVDVTPTYTGCPATAVIAADVAAAVREAGVSEVRVHTVLSPAWTTDWISAEGREKLREYGIAPPGPTKASSSTKVGLTLMTPMTCPRCGSRNTHEVSRFGSTPCKSLWTCKSCAEPFDSFKAI